MSRNSFSPITFPSPVKTIWGLLLVLVSIELLIMWGLPYLEIRANPILENLVDAILLGLLFFPFLYRYLFRPFQNIAVFQQSVTQNIMSQLVDGVLIIDAQGRVQSINSAAERIFGYRAEELIGQEALQLLCTDSRQQFQRFLARSAAGDGPACREFTGHGKDGTHVPLDLSVSRMETEKGEVRMVIVRDISERKRGEAELKNALALLSATLESTTDGILVRDLEGHAVITNRRFAEMWHIPEAVVAAKSEALMRAHVADQLKDPQAFLQLAARQYEDPSVVSKDQLDFIDGRVFERISVPHLIDRTIVGRLICFRDITEQKKLEHQLRHAQKMEALGTLAGGVAHDFNNILTVILGYCELVAYQVPQNDAVRHDLDQIALAAERAASLTKSLLAYSRKTPLDMRPMDLNQTVQRFDKFLKRLIGEDVELRCSLCDEQIRIHADSGQIEQLLMNLAANARDAMQGRGCLLLQTTAIAIDDSFIRHHGFGSPGRYALISVSDTGKGMDEKTREKVFEPFFTTKKPGEGTGLGLSIAYGVVRQHDGHITVYSEPGKGTTFNIYLPIVRQSAEIPKPEPVPVRGGNETLLVSEDDPAVRALVRSVLAGAGYRVIEATDGADAVEKFGAHREEIDLLLLDVMTPKKNGKEAYLEIAAERPGVKAIFMSGYTADIIAQHGLGGDDPVLLNKPLSPNQLLVEIDRMLRG